MSFPNSITLSYAQVITQGTTQKCPLGTRGLSSDGRVFRYAKAGASDIAVGMGVIPATPIDLCFATTITRSLCLNAGTTVKTSENVFMVGGSGGAVGATANAFKEGWLMVGSTQGLGIQMLKIKSHGAITLGGTGQSVTFTLDDGVFPTSNINSSKNMAIFPNPYDGVLVMTTIAVPLMPIIGVTPIDVTAANYFWAQTAGFCMARMCEACSSGLNLGRRVTPSGVAATTGFYPVTSSGETAAEGGFTMIGTLVHGCAAANYGVVNLTIAP